MAAENIFQQYLRPVRSVQEYSSDLDAQEQNRLALATARMQHQTGQQAFADDQAYRSAAIDSGGDQNALIRALMSKGLAKQAQSMQTAGIANAKTVAETNKANAQAGHFGAQTDTSKYELQTKKHDKAIQVMAGLNTPEEAIADLDRHVQAGEIQPDQANAIRQSIPQDPAQFPGWQVKMLRNIMAAKDQVALAQPDANTVAKNDTSRQNNAATLAESRRGKDMTDKREREKNQILRESIGKVDWKLDADGNWIALPKEVRGGEPVTPVTTTGPGKRAIQAKHAIDIIKEARGLVDEGTSSYLGAGLDQAARIVGVGTAGAQKTSQLKALEGALMMAQPRMEGPQSDKDVMLYRQMAGQLGDPTVPAVNKKAALDAIESLHSKYTKPTSNAATPTAAPAKNIKGWALHTDANGNRAYVSPDGKSFEEVK